MDELSKQAPVLLVMRIPVLGGGYLDPPVNIPNDIKTAGSPTYLSIALGGHTKLDIAAWLVENELWEAREWYVCPRIDCNGLTLLKAPGRIRHLLERGDPCPYCEESGANRCRRCDAPLDPENDDDLCDYCQHMWDRMEDE